MTTRVLLVEDEAIARRHLRELLAEYEWMHCVGEAGDGITALALIDALRPDLVFLDIELPELSGLEVLRRMAHNPDIVITTAYDRYAVAAFELEAVDYLLKPFGADRLRKTAERLQRGMQLSSGDVLSPPTGAVTRARDVLERLADGSRPTRLFVRDRGKVVQVSIGEIERLEAQDDYVAVITHGRRYLVYLGMAEFEARLDPRSFVRIHRSHIVNLDFVAAFASHDPTRLEVEMRDGTRLLASRTRSKALRHLVSL
ncbi:MAG: LytTR family DNA-binding domain-containing protein [bacterium]